MNYGKFILNCNYMYDDCVIIMSIYKIKNCGNLKKERQFKL